MSFTTTWNGTHTGIPQRLRIQNQPEVVTYFPADRDEKTLQLLPAEVPVRSGAGTAPPEVCSSPSGNVTHGHPVNA